MFYTTMHEPHNKKSKFCLPQAINPTTPVQFLCKSPANSQYSTVYCIYLKQGHILASLFTQCFLYNKASVQNAEIKERPCIRN
jgi:hypothetical protein